MKAALCVFAHPDDELFAGGILCHLAEHGVGVHLLCATRGDNGAPGYPPVSNQSQLGQIRTEEMRCSAAVIGARSLTFLDYYDAVAPDGTLIEFAADEPELQTRIAEAIRHTEASLVITHGSDGEYGHPAHKLMHRSTLAAAHMLYPNVPLVYSFQAIHDRHPDPTVANQSDSAHLVLHTERYFQTHLIKMFLCHQTQSSWWIHTKSEALGRTAAPEEAWILAFHESLHRHYPLIDGVEVEDELTRWLAKYPL